MLIGDEGFGELGEQANTSLHLQELRWARKEFCHKI